MTTTTIAQGYAVQMLGFIPIHKGDLRKQSEIPLLLLDIQEGRKTIADLIPHIKDVEFRQQHVGRRVTAEQMEAWNKPAQQPGAEADGEQQQTEAETAPVRKGKAAPPVGE